MNIILIPSLLGMAAFVLLVAASKGDSKVSIIVWPPGIKVFSGECVLLRCRVESNSTLGWRYRWFRNQPGATHMGKNPRHLLSGGYYSITAVMREDTGRYWCQAHPDSNATDVLLSRPVRLNVSDLLPPSLTLTPNFRQLFVGETFTLQCPDTLTNSFVWFLRQNSTNHLTKFADSMTAGPVIMSTPASTIPQGRSVILACRYWKGNHTKSTFFRNGVKMSTCNSSGPDTETKLTIENVTVAHEGFYKCASQDGNLESLQSWLSVKRDLFTVDETAGSSSDSWIWVVVSCILMLLIPLTILLIHHFRYKMLYTHSCWTVPGGETPAAVLPATKQDVTEVQWDLSWMEMSNLLYPST
ncbi:uncharacterized protein LOC130918717 isoform X3 [Corythoichthys intestinalis]|uniref:uncharacterized protein LOC130918717 isoform X3 n=1 Tax=Corythoichthys intestinalis TaxID=161448 RepID=UPI0025A6177F|nr:uncharacterized protein LOC130918717 isoform X3 [Corythoichthys intestinalis]